MLRTHNPRIRNPGLEKCKMSAAQTQDFLSERFFRPGGTFCIFIAAVFQTEERHA